MSFNFVEKLKKTSFYNCFFSKAIKSRLEISYQKDNVKKIKSLIENNTAPSKWTRCSYISRNK